MHLLNGDVVAQHRMVGAARGDPALHAGGQVGQGFPHDAGHRQIGHGQDGLDALDVLADQAQTAAHIDEAHDDGLAGLALKDQTGGVLLVQADAQVMGLDAGLLRRSAGADFRQFPPLTPHKRCRLFRSRTRKVCLFLLSEVIIIFPRGGAGLFFRF